MISLWVVGLIVSYMGLLHFQSGYCDEVINGKKVKPHSLPHMALLIDKCGDPACGGTLIGSKWVLTAAHCEGITEVWLGVHSIKAKEKKYRQIHAVSETYPHPSYDSKKKVNDIMLLKLKEDVKETKTVKYLSVLKTTAKDPEPGSRCLVAGWGKVNHLKTKMSDVLMSATVTVIDRNTCNSPDYYNQNPVITGNMICAGSVGKKKKAVADTCVGDSGGPMQCNGILVGITSFGGKECGSVDKPGVYTFLTKDYIEWIKKKTGLK